MALKGNKKKNRDKVKKREPVESFGIVTLNF